MKKLYNFCWCYVPLWVYVIQCMQKRKFLRRFIMFGFGGPETKAEHLYAAGASYVEFCNGYYKMYAKVFLAQHAFCIKNCYHPGKEEWIVPYTKDLFYKVGWQWFGCLYRDEPIVMGSYDLKMEQGIALLDLKYKNGEKSFYICLNRKCNIKSK